MFVIRTFVSDHLVPRGFEQCSYYEHRSPPLRARQWATDDWKMLYPEPAIGNLPHQVLHENPRPERTGSL